MKKYPVITLCGSTKFKDEFIEYTKRFTLNGYVVLSVGLFGHSGSPEAFEPTTKKMLDEIHRRKIDMSDMIFVINKDGYIGEGTRSEIDYAEKMGRSVIYMEPAGGK